MCDLLHSKSDNYNLLQSQKMFLPNAKIIFDVGMHHGKTTQEYLEAFPDAHIYAFEAEHQNFLLGKKMLDGHQSRLTLIESAVSNIFGKVCLNINSHDGTHSILSIGKLQYWAGLVTTKRSENVSSTTLDNYCDLNNVAHIDILKMDIQGAELEALKGANNLLSKNKIKMIVAEVEFRELYKNQPLYMDVAIYLRAYGYSLVGLYDLQYINGTLSWADAIFLLDN